jgi:hypothetical protein
MRYALIALLLLAGSPNPVHAARCYTVCDNGVCSYVCL